MLWHQELGARNTQRLARHERFHMNDSDDIFFEDVIPGDTIHAGPYVIPPDELVAFASAWDPMPMHINQAFAAEHGGLTAPGIYSFRNQDASRPYVALTPSGYCDGRL